MYPCPWQDSWRCGSIFTVLLREGLAAGMRGTMPRFAQQQWTETQKGPWVFSTAASGRVSTTRLSIADRGILKRDFPDRSWWKFNG